MSMPLPEGYVLPKPGIPKTLGILSIIFGVLALLLGLCSVASDVFFGPMMEAMSGAVKTAQAPLQQKIQAKMDALAAKEKAATTAEEKASIQQERESLEATKDLTSGNAGMKIAQEMMSDPTVKSVTTLFLVARFLLGSLLLYAGIGLVKLKDWGRKSGVIWGVIALVWLVIHLVLQFALILPAQQQYQDRQMVEMQAQMKKINNPNMPDMAQLTKVTQAATTVGIVGQMVVSGIFPTVMLILLSGKGARAACQAKSKPDPFTVI